VVLDYKNFQFLHAAWNASADYSNENGVCLSVRLSNAYIVTKRKKDLSRLSYHAKSFSLLRKRMVGGSLESDPLYLKF